MKKYNFYSTKIFDQKTYPNDCDLERRLLRGGLGVNECCFFSFFSFRMILSCWRDTWSWVFCCSRLFTLYVSSPFFNNGPPTISSSLSPLKYHPFEVKWTYFSASFHFSASSIVFSLNIMPIWAPRKFAIYLKQLLINTIMAVCHFLSHF